MKKNYMDYVPDSELINALVNTIDLSTYFRDITERTGNLMLPEDVPVDADMNPVATEQISGIFIDDINTKCMKVYEVYLKYKNRFEQGKNIAIDDLFSYALFFEAADDILDLALFAQRIRLLDHGIDNVTESPDASKKRFSFDNKRCDLIINTTSIKNAYESDNIVKTYLYGDSSKKENVTVVTLSGFDKEIKFALGENIDIYLVETMVVFNRLVYMLAVELGDMLDLIFNSAFNTPCKLDYPLEFINRRRELCYVSDRKERNDNGSTHKRHPLRSLFSKRTV